MADELGTQRNAWDRLREYTSNVRVEMRRVTWPSKQEVYGTTVMVVLTTFFFGVYFWICDQAFSYGMSRILKLFLHPG